MTFTVNCPICRKTQHVTTTTGSGAHYCSIACYRTGHGQPQLPPAPDTARTPSSEPDHRPATPTPPQEDDILDDD